MNGWVDEELRRIATNKEVSKSWKTKQKAKYLFEAYGYLLDLPNNCIPEEHKAKGIKTIKCFGRSFVRNPKTKEKQKNSKGKFKRKRCSSPCVKGTFYCHKHGGGNTHALVNNKSRNPILSLYRKQGDPEFGDLIEAYLQDETVLDVKPELASLRAALNKYTERLVNAKPVNPKVFVKGAKNIMEEDYLSDYEKYVALKALADSVETLTSGDSLDRLTRIVDTISRVIHRVQTAANNEQYILTPDGLKVFLRCIIDIIKEHVEDVGTVNKIKEGFLEISTITKGKLGNYHNIKKENIKDADFTVEKSETG